MAKKKKEMTPDEKPAHYNSRGASTRWTRGKPAQQQRLNTAKNK